MPTTFNKNLNRLNIEELEPLSPTNRANRKKNQKGSFFEMPGPSLVLNSSAKIGTLATLDSLEPEIPVADAIIPANWDEVEWQKRPGAGEPVTGLSIVVCFKRWDVDSGSWKEILIWDGVLELYRSDCRLLGFPTARGMPENIWRPKPIGSTGFDLGLAEKGKSLPKFSKTTNKDGVEISDGSINMKCDFKLGNGGVNMSDYLKRFKSFPYDSVRIDVVFQFHNPCKDGDTFPYIEADCNRPNLKHRIKDGDYQHVDWTGTRHSNDYFLSCFGYAIGKNPEPLWGNPAESLNAVLLSLQISRTPNFYVSKGMQPLYLVSFFGLVRLD